MPHLKKKSVLILIFISISWFDVSPYPLLGPQDGGGSVDDDAQADIARLAQLLLLVAHDGAQGVHQDLGVHALQLACLVTHGEGAWGGGYRVEGQKKKKEEEN